MQKVACNLIQRRLQTDVDQNTTDDIVGGMGPLGGEKEAEYIYHHSTLECRERKARGLASKVAAPRKYSEHRRTKRTEHVKRCVSVLYHARNAIHSTQRCIFVPRARPGMVRRRNMTVHAEENAESVRRPR